jgi:hypothetical protein
MKFSNCLSYIIEENSRIMLCCTNTHTYTVLAGSLVLSVSHTMGLAAHTVGLVAHTIVTSSGPCGWPSFGISGNVIQ